MNHTSKLNRAASLFIMLVLLTISWLPFAQPVEAQSSSPIRYLAGFQTYTLPANDDSSTGAVPIGFTVDFFGRQHDSLYVNNNGNITFDATQSTYTPYDLTSTTREIIAAFFGDVDTRGSGSSPVTYGNDTVNGRMAFGVNYIDVGYYQYGIDKLNSFQLILIDRSDTGFGNFDIEFNFEKVQWETGNASGGSGGLGGYSARVGFSNGTGAAGTFFELPGSAVNGAFLDTNPDSGLIYNSFSSTETGRYVFEGRNGEINLSHNPLIFVPGVGGSKLINNSGEVWTNVPWLLTNIWDAELSVLRLNDQGTGPLYPSDPTYSSVEVGDIVRTEIIKDVYTSTVNYFTQTLNYEEGVDFFVCPYDWRKHIPDIAAGGLNKTLDKCIDYALALNPEETKVDILAHSMGGLISRYYVSDPNRAEKVDHLVTIGTPYLGAPKIALAVLDKMCFIDFILGTCFVNQTMLHEIIQNFPSGYEIAPSRSYFDVYPGYIYRDWDANGNGIVDGWLNYSETSTLLNSHNSWLTAQARDFSDLYMAGWALGGTNNVKVLVMVGSGIPTPSLIREKLEPDGWFSPNNHITYSIQDIVGGDGTVPLNSANMRNLPGGVDLSGNVSTVYFYNRYDHGELAKRSEVLRVADTFFQDRPEFINSLKDHATNKQDTLCTIDKETGDTTCNSKSADIQRVGYSLDPILLTGHYLSFNINAIVDIIDQFGNRIGMIDEGGTYEVNIPGAGYYPLDQHISVFLPNDRTYQIFIDGQAVTNGLVRIQEYLNDNLVQTTVYESILMGENSTAIMDFDPNGVDGNILVDQDGDGNMDAQVGVGAILDNLQSADTISPQTTISVDGVLTDGWYVGYITVTITAEDNPGGVGVDRIEYSFDNGQTIQEYTGPFIIDANIYRLVTARSIDFAGNSSWDSISACYLLNPTHAGSGIDPQLEPANSTGCEAGRYHEGETITLTGAPDNGWVIGHWVGTDNDNNTAATNILTMPASNHTVSVSYSKIIQRKLLSLSSQDGWVLESGEKTLKGGSMDPISVNLRLGDDEGRKQFRSILSFSSGASLPDNAVITKVTLKVKKQGVAGGSNPVNIFQGFMVDIRRGIFGTSALQLTDWQARAGKTLGPLMPLPVNNWYAFDLTSISSYINKLGSGGGLTQIRLRFKVDDNNNGIANYLSLFSGNAGTYDRPQLIIKYYVP